MRRVCLALHNSVKARWLLRPIVQVRMFIPMVESLRVFSVLNIIYALEVWLSWLPNSFWASTSFLSLSNSNTRSVWSFVFESTVDFRSVFLSSFRLAFNYLQIIGYFWITYWTPRFEQFNLIEYCNSTSLLLLQSSVDCHNYFFNVWFVFRAVNSDLSSSFLYQLFYEGAASSNNLRHQVVRNK